MYLFKFIRLYILAHRLSVSYSSMSIYHHVICGTKDTVQNFKPVSKNCTHSNHRLALVHVMFLFNLLMFYQWCLVKLICDLIIVVNVCTAIINRLSSHWYLERNFEWWILIYPFRIFRHNVQFPFLLEMYDIIQKIITALRVITSPHTLFWWTKPTGHFGSAYLSFLEYVKYEWSIQLHCHVSYTTSVCK